MNFDIFLSICQTEVDGFMPSEKQMFENFFDQVKLADQLGYETAWIAETHLSCQTQKQTSNAVIPEFVGEIGLNTDVLQMAQIIFSKTKNINVGSAIRNILCNGGPVAHAEAVRTFLKLKDVVGFEGRKLCLGFASGRFDFANEPYGIRPRTLWEKQAWPALKGKILSEATEIFLRLLKGETLSSSDISYRKLSRADFRSDEDWNRVVSTYNQEMKLMSLEDVKFKSSHPRQQKHEINFDDQLCVEKFWVFEKLTLIPTEVSLKDLQLTLGTHDASLQNFANTILPVSVFNLSITPQAVIDETHQRMKTVFHKDGGPWTQGHMPRTALIFIDQTEGLSAKEQNEKAKQKAEKAWTNYWKAMEGTLDPEKIKNAVGNAIYGNCDQVARQMKEKYHKDDRLMLWFDFNNHDNDDVKKSMELFIKNVKPKL